MTMITPSYLGETIEYSSLHACRSTLEDPTAYYSAQNGAALSHALAAATIATFPFAIKDAAGKVVAQGEAGDGGHDLPAGDYTVVVQAGDQSLTLPHLTIAAGQTAAVKVTRKGDGFAVGR